MDHEEEMKQRSRPSPDAAVCDARLTAQRQTFKTNRLFHRECCVNALSMDISAATYALCVAKLEDS